MQVRNKALHAEGLLAVGADEVLSTEDDDVPGRVMELTGAKFSQFPPRRARFLCGIRQAPPCHLHGKLCTFLHSQVDAATKGVACGLQSSP